MSLALLEMEGSRRAVVPECKGKVISEWGAGRPFLPGAIAIEKA